MHDAQDPLDTLKHALDSLSAPDLAEWTEQVENRLTERLRMRQGRPPQPSGSGGEPADNPEEYPDA